MNQRKQFESNMKTLLRHVIDQHSLPDDSHLDMLVLSECCSREYLSGVVVQTMISGKIVCDVRNTIWVTKAGLEFLYPRQDWKFIVSSAIALISIVVNIIQAVFL